MKLVLEETYKYCQNHMQIFMPVLSCIHTEIHTLKHNFTNHYNLRTFRIKGTAVQRFRGEGSLGFVACKGLECVAST